MFGDVIVKIEGDFSHSISNTSISGVKFSWTTLYFSTSRCECEACLSVHPSKLYPSVRLSVTQNTKNKKTGGGRDVGIFMGVMVLT